MKKQKFFKKAKKHLEMFQDVFCCYFDTIILVKYVSSSTDKGTLDSISNV